MACMFLMPMRKTCSWFSCLWVRYLVGREATHLLLEGLPLSEVHLIRDQGPHLLPFFHVSKDKLLYKRPVKASSEGLGHEAFVALAAGVGRLPSPEVLHADLVPVFTNNTRLFKPLVIGRRPGSCRTGVPPW